MIRIYSQALLYLSKYLNVYNSTKLATSPVKRLPSAQTLGQFCLMIIANLVLRNVLENNPDRKGLRIRLIPYLMNSYLFDLGFIHRIHIYDLHSTLNLTERRNAKAHKIAFAH